MEYEFSLGSLVLGLLIMIAGAAFMRWHQVIADNLGGGVSSYDKYKLYALITCGIGFLVMTNLLWFVLGSILSLIFKRS